MSARLLKDPATVSSRIFVGHLQTDDMTKHELEEHFSKYGTVIGSLINRGFGFVQFDEEQAAQNAIQNEDGAMFKGRRIDVRPAKKDNQSNSGGGGSGTGGNATNSGNDGKGGNMSAASAAASGSGKLNVPNNQFNPGNNQFNTGDSFKAGNKNFGGGNTGFSNVGQNFGTDGQFGGNQKGSPNVSNQYDTSQNSGSEQFGNGNANRVGNDQFNNSNQNRSDQFSPNNQNRGCNEPMNFGGTPGNQNRGGNQFGQIGNQSGAGRPRGTRGGKNRNKNRDSAGGNNFRDRSPINRGARTDDKTVREWDHKQGERVRLNSFGRDSFSDGGNRFDDFKGSAPRDMNISFGSTSGSSDYPPIGAEKNDCEIIVVNKSLTEYAEAIEMRLKKIGLTVDLLFPNEDVLLSRVLGNIASRGCLYAVVVTPVNQEHHSLTLNILHGLPQEHRNMPVEDAITLISRDFVNYKSGGRSVPLNTPYANERHADAVQVLLNMLADNRQLTVLQYDKVIKYLEVKREEQVQVELGDVKDLPPTTTLTVNDPKQAELQSRILNILNSNKASSLVPAPSPVPAPTTAPAPIPSANWGAGKTHYGFPVLTVTITLRSTDCPSVFCITDLVVSINRNNPICNERIARLRGSHQTFSMGMVPTRTTRR